MTPVWRRVLIVGGVVLGIAIVALLAVIAYALLGEEDGEPAAQVAQPTTTATPTPVVARTPEATPTPTPPPPTPTPTPEPTEEPPPPAPVEEQPPPVEEPPPVDEPPPPPPTEEPPPPPPPPTEEPPPPPATEEPPPPSAEEFLMDIMVQGCEGGSWEACVQACEGGIEEACQALDVLLPYYSQPARDTEGEIVVETCIDGQFTGWSGDTVFELCNGQVWIQASYAYLYHYAYRPAVTIVSTDQGYRLFVEGVSDSILVARVTDFIRTCIDGDFEGWEGETIFVLCNGQVWQQSSYDYTYHYAYRPDVLIYRTGSRYRMKVERVRETIEVIRLQ